MKIAIIAIQKSTYSETFISNLCISLKEEVCFSWNMGMEWEDECLHPDGDSLTYQERKVLLTAKLKKENIEVIIAQFGITGVYTCEAAMELKIPLIVHFHGFDAYAKHILMSYSQYYKEMFRYASKVIAVSKDMVNQLARLGAKKKSIVYTPCAPHDMFFENNPNFDKKYFVSVGRFVNKKAPYLTISAYRDLVQLYPDTKLLMIGGDEPLKEVCVNLVTAWGIEKNVDFLGILDPIRIKEVFQNAYCFVQHSVIAKDGDAEGTPVALMEASASGLPVVATSHKGIKDVVIHEKTGILVDEYDTKAMVKAMQKIYLDKQLAISYGQEGRLFIRNHYSMNNDLHIIGKCIHEVR